MSLLSTSVRTLLNSLDNCLEDDLRGPGGLHQNSLEIDLIVVSGRRE